MLLQVLLKTLQRSPILIAGGDGETVDPPAEPEVLMMDGVALTFDNEVLVL
jgi:hypothetical protein